MEHMEHMERINAIMDDRKTTLLILTKATIAAIESEDGYTEKLSHILEGDAKNLLQHSKTKKRIYRLEHRREWDARQNNPRE